MHGAQLGSMASNSSAPESPRGRMVRVPGGVFRMGSDGFYPEERPVHQVAVDRFWIDRHPVTNTEFSRFVQATGHVRALTRSLAAWSRAARISARPTTASAIAQRSAPIFELFRGIVRIATSIFVIAMTLNVGLTQRSSEILAYLKT